MWRVNWLCVCLEGRGEETVRCPGGDDDRGRALEKRMNLTRVTCLDEYGGWMGRGGPLGGGGAATLMGTWREVQAEGWVGWVFNLKLLI